MFTNDTTMSDIFVSMDRESKEFREAINIRHFHVYGCDQPMAENHTDITLRVLASELEKLAEKAGDIALVGIKQSMLNRAEEVRKSLRPSPFKSASAAIAETLLEALPQNGEDILQESFDNMRGGSSVNFDGSDRPPGDYTDDEGMLFTIVHDIMPSFEGVEDCEQFKQGEDSFAAFCHSQLSGGIGMQIRNKYQLWEEGTRYRWYFQETLNIAHPDDMSDRIIREVYRKMVNKKK